jgi:murein DD-endopeptidase MepM/ murein hydrolase activator NlpD
MIRIRWILLVIIVLLIAWAFIHVSYVKLEGQPPELTLTPEPQALGHKTAFTLVSSDRRSGLKQIQVEIMQKGKRASLISETLSPGTRRAERTFEVVPSSLELEDGDAVIRAEARDRSWRRGGNPRVLEARVVIDTRPPTIAVLSRFHYINQGGSGLVVYKASEKLTRSGVEVGDIWFPGFPVENGGYVALFAVPHDAPKETQITLLGEDLAENRARVTFNYHIKPKKFRGDKVRLSDGFLQRVMPYFLDRYPSVQGNQLEAFKYVNRDLREENENRIREICKETTSRSLWEGPFLRMPQAKTMSGFAARRIYIYKGEEIDRQVHLGVDLAAVVMSPVQAANRGVVAFVGELGIYGNTVLLDHGFGLFSMYAHLSRIDVQPGQMVEKGASLGTTGSTGLAGGDHLHFSILVSGVYVNPVEWWDPHWVKDNISSKFAELVQ